MEVSRYLCFLQDSFFFSKRSFLQDVAWFGNAYPIVIFMKDKSQVKWAE